MTNDTKKRFTLRLPIAVSESVESKAKALGLSRNGYINMILHKEFYKQREGDQ